MLSIVAGTHSYSVGAYYFYCTLSLYDSTQPDSKWSFIPFLFKNFFLTVKVTMLWVDTEKTQNHTKKETEITYLAPQIMGDVVCYTYNSDVIESIWEYMPQNSFVLFCIAGTTLPMCSPFLLLHAPCLFITGCSPPLTWCSRIPASLPPCLQLSPPSQGWISSCQQQPDIGRFFFFSFYGKRGKSSLGEAPNIPGSEPWWPC